MQNRSVRTTVSVASLLAGVSLWLGPTPAHAFSVTVDPSNWRASTSAGLSEDPSLQDAYSPGSLPVIINNPGNAGASAGVTITGFPAIAVAASSANNDTFASASGNLTFFFELVANPDYGGTATGIPILLDGTSSQSLKGSAGGDSTSVGMTIEALTSSTQGSTFDLDTSNKGVFTGDFDIASGVEYEVDMFAYVSAHGASSGAAAIDPMLTVDPNFFDGNDLNFIFSNGISNGVSSTPLPAALPLFAGGLGVMGLLARRRKRKAAAIAA